ncbi:LLM class flavin-dependent oxidoreductase [Pseudonocardia sp. GCM10023141]|uniref:LLM class flavin-dependent oxidoreductase n=1 Tax=Pseudonocardia sp. GCM10023141 TaxID=3252653 RepID=UPI003622B35D
MRVSLRVRYAGPAALAELVRAAEDGGYDGLWVSEPWGVDAGPVLGWCAATTRRLLLGTHVVSVFARTAAATAGLATSLQTLSDGRFRLGLGTSGPQVVEGWHGVAFERPVAVTGETIAVVRAALAGEPLQQGGSRPLRTAWTGGSLTVPIYLGALGPRNQRLTADAADGWTPTPYSPDHHATFAAPLVDRLAGNGRTVAIAPVCPVAMGSDVTALLALEKGWSGLYLGGMGTFYADAARAMGFGDAVAAVREHWRNGDRRAARDAVPDGYADAIGLFGSPQRIRDRIERYAAAGVDELVVELRKPDLGDQLADLRAFRKAVG